MEYRIVEQVFRKQKRMTAALKRTMIVCAVLFVLMGVMIAQAFMLAGFLSACLYFVYDALSRKEYEYTMENGRLVIDVIYGGQYRKTAHDLDLGEMEVTAPGDHPAVAKYRKKGGQVRLKKYDYTSYEEEVPYYTMIITENGQKIKLLLDLTEEMLRVLKRMYASKVYFA